MIKLDLPCKPIQLTTELQSHLTQEYKTTKKSVWNIDWLKKAIFNLAYGKCCYSEIRLGEESKYMEVEHFHPKKLYPDEVLLWGNLFPSCKKCNSSKGDCDTVNEPIINPFVDNPKEFLCFKNYRYFPKNKNEVGYRTIEILALNDRDHFVYPRFKIANDIIERLEDFKEHLYEIQDNSKRHKYISKFKRLLQLGNRKEEYSALVASTILSDDNYIEITVVLQSNKFWDEEFKALSEELEFCSLL